MKLNYNEIISESELALIASQQLNGRGIPIVNVVTLRIKIYNISDFK